MAAWAMGLSRYSECRTQVIRPDDDRKHRLPKAEMQKTDRKKPRPDPETARQRMVLYFYFFHIVTIPRHA